MTTLNFYKILHFYNQDKVDEYIVYKYKDAHVIKEKAIKVYEKKAVMTSLSGDGQEAVISYTFDNGAGSASVQVQPEQTPSSPTTAEPTALKDANFYVEKPVQGTKPSTVVRGTPQSREILLIVI